MVIVLNTLRGLNTLPMQLDMAVTLDIQGQRDQNVSGDGCDDADERAPFSEARATVVVVLAVHRRSPS